MYSIVKRFSSVVVLLPLVLVVSCKATTTHEGEPEASGSQAPTEKAKVVGRTQVASPDKAIEPDKQPATAVGRSPAPEKKEQASAAQPEPEPQTASKPAASSQQQVSVAPAPAAPAEPAPKPKKVLNPNDPRSVVYLGSDGKMAGTGNPNEVVSDAFKFGQGATAKSLTAPGLPKDKFGLIDWIAMVDQEIIKPIGSLKPGGMEIPPFDMNVVIQAKGDFVNDVLFRHKTHTYWLSCEICHTGIFIMAKGKNNMTMQGITQGKWCGRCHGKVSFPLTDCTRCHSQPKKEKTAAAGG